ncbi:hypothetical protein LTR12_011004 [Friedmanniomyces endolithicus]|nr:hypothetical protein LTR12_011004 [Friedmanniomyces endolithicus]
MQSPSTKKYSMACDMQGGRMRNTTGRETYSGTDGGKDVEIDRGISGCQRSDQRGTAEPAAAPSRGCLVSGMGGSLPCCRTVDETVKEDDDGVDRELTSAPLPPQQSTAHFPHVRSLPMHSSPPSEASAACALSPTSRPPCPSVKDGCASVSSVAELQAKLAALDSLDDVSLLCNGLLQLLRQASREVLEADAKAVPILDRVERLGKAAQDDIWRALGEPVFEKRMKILQRQRKSRTVLLEEIEQLKVEPGYEPSFAALGRRLREELHSWPKNLLSWMAAVANGTKKRRLSKPGPQTFGQMLHYVNVRNLHHVLAELEKAKITRVFRCRLDLRPTEAILEPSGSSIDGQALEDLLDYDLKSAVLPDQCSDMRLGIGEDGLLCLLLKDAQSIAKTLRARVPASVDPLAHAPTAALGETRVLRPTLEGRWKGHAVHDSSTVADDDQQHAEPLRKKTWSRGPVASAVTASGPAAPSGVLPHAPPRPPINASQLPEGCVAPLAAVRSHASSADGDVDPGRTILDELREEAEVHVGAILSECERVLQDLDSEHTSGAPGPGADKLRRLLRVLDQRTWVTGWWPSEDNVAFGGCLRDKESADVHFYTAVTWSSARYWKGALRVPTVVVDGELRDLSTKLQDRFIYGLETHHPDTKVEAQHAPLHEVDGASHSPTNHITIRQALQLIKEPCKHISARSWTSIIDLLNLNDIVKHPPPEFFRHRNTDLLRTARAWADVFAAEPIGKYSAANDLGSGLFGCVSFVLYAIRGSWSDLHLDVLNGTWVRCLHGRKLWPLALDLTRDEQAELAELGCDWLPPAGKFKSLLLKPGYTLIMPAGEFIPHAPLTLEDCLMDGGRYWDERAVLRVLENMQFIFANADCTNEELPRGLRETLIGLKMIIFDRLEGDWQSLDESDTYQDASVYRKAFNEKFAALRAQVACLCVPGRCVANECVCIKRGWGCSLWCHDVRKCIPQALKELDRQELWKWDRAHS